MSEDNKKPGLPPPDVDWNDMQPGQIGWSVEPKPDGWDVRRMFGAESLVSEPGFHP